MRLIKKISLLKDFSKITPVLKGFSSDEKFRVTVGITDYLVRFFPLETMNKRKQEFELLQLVQNYTMYTLKPLEIGDIDGKGYFITNYFQGVDMEDGLGHLTAEEQYEIGFLAGQELGKIHQIHAPSTEEPWETRKLKKHERYIREYEKCGVSFAEEKQVMNFIQSHLHLLKNRPNMLLHDDFHPANLILKDKKLEGIIDFGRYEWGDPIHDFTKLGLFSRNVSIPFSIGQLKGYFNGEEPPNQFWEIYSLYMATILFSNIVWAKNLHPTNLYVLMDKNEVILKDHDNFTLTKPKWFTEGWC